MNKKLLVLGAFFGLLSVILGAFGAHGLKAVLTTESLQTFETGVKYQMYHAILLLIVGSSSYVSQKIKNAIFYLILIGILFFSGSIYGLSTNAITSFNFKSIAIITPIGGLFLIVAWLLLLISFVKNNYN